MKTIIIAAGRGQRLGSLTIDIPKCLLSIIKNKNILDLQLSALYANYINNIIIIKGYRAEKINYPLLKSYCNHDFENNNILCSLMTAIDEMNVPFIASYSDIIYSKHVVKKLLDSPYDISVVVDTDWQTKYQGRTQHPETEAEKAIFDESGKILEMGKHLINLPKNKNGEFIGLFKCSQKGAEIFCDAFKEAKSKFAQKKFFNASVFENAYITDMMLYLIQKEVSIHIVPITERWMEIDTKQDLEKAKQWMQDEFFKWEV
ncbi:MAG: sugar phosphate nucleotidyltransferase [Pseudomonadota bacterium]